MGLRQPRRAPVLCLSPSGAGTAGKQRHLPLIDGAVPGKVKQIPRGYLVSPSPGTGSGGPQPASARFLVCASSTSVSRVSITAHVMEELTFGRRDEGERRDMFRRKLAQGCL